MAVFGPRKVFLQKFPSITQRENARKIPLTAEFENENKEKYLTPEMIVQDRLSCIDTLYYNHEKQLLNESMFYDLLDKDKLYAWSNRKRRHSYESQGEPVDAAGKVYFCFGQPITWSNESGHYKPTKEQMIPALKYFLKNSKNAPLLFEDHSQQNIKLPFYGVRYYKIWLDNNGEVVFDDLNPQRLLAYLKEAQNAAFERYVKDSLKNMEIAPGKSNTSPLEGYSTSTSPQTTPLRDTSVEEAIFYSPAEKRFTFLERYTLEDFQERRAKGQLVSCYNASPKKSKRRV